MPKGFAVFDMLRVYRYAGHRTDLYALWRLKMTDTFGTFVRINLVDFDSHEDRAVRAFGLADVAINALVRNGQCHRLTFITS